MARKYVQMGKTTAENVTVLNDNFSELYNNDNSIFDDVEQLQADVSQLQTDMSAAQSDISTLQQDSGWINLSLNSGWTMNDYVAEVPQYRKIGKTVYLRGLVNATAAASNIIATLPAGYRPSGYFNRFACALNQGEFVMVQINANGQINDYGKGTNGRAFLSLNGVSFPADY